MEEPDVASGKVAYGLDAKEEGSDGAHDQGLITRDTHVPKREVPDADAKGSQHGPKDKSIVHICRSINESGPGKGI